MDLSQLARRAGMVLAAISLVLVIAWLVTGAAPPPNLETLENASSETHYISFGYTGTEESAARILKKLSDEGYPAVDSLAGTRDATQHNFVIQRPFYQAEAVVIVAKLSRELSTGGGSIGSLQEQFFLGDMLKGKYPFGQLFVFAMAQAEQPAARALLFVIAASVLAAALLALLILARGGRTPAMVWLGSGLGCWSVAISYLWLFSVAPAFAVYQPADLAVRMASDVAAFALLLIASYAYIRFWKNFPQSVSDAELSRFLDVLKAEQVAKAGATTRRWFALFARRQARGGEAAIATPELEVRTASRETSFRVLILASVSVAVLGAGFAWTGGFTLPEYLAVPAIPYAFLVFVLLTYWPGITCLRVFKYHRMLGSAEDCRKIEWIWASIWLGFVVIVLPCVLLAVLYIGRYFVPGLEAYEHLGDMLFIFGLTSGPLFVILALAVSILYRGTIDPRLALRGVTLWSVLGVFLTLLFVLVERSIAVKLAKWWGLAPQTGYVTAGAIVAATFQPVRKRAETYVNRFVERVLPATVLSSGTRRTQAVAVVDISGYTALSAKDEQSALVASALVQKEARRVAERGGGRVVKSTGDGVIMCFDNAQKALEAVTGLHRAVRASAVTLDLPQISLHSGLHWGGIVEMRDGDIYGMTVNLAARLADWARAGEIGVSRVLHDQLTSTTAAFEDAGPQTFKNVPEVVACLKLADGG